MATEKLQKLTTDMRARAIAGALPSPDTLRAMDKEDVRALIEIFATARMQENGNPQDAILTLQTQLRLDAPLIEDLKRDGNFTLLLGGYTLNEIPSERQSREALGSKNGENNGQE